jgi:hypothetical protein
MKTELNGTFMQIYYIVIFIIVLTLHISIYMWIDKLEKDNCDCSKLWHRDILKAFAILLFIFTCINLYIYHTNNYNQNQIQNMMMNNKFMLYVFTPISAIIGISYMFIMFDYIYKLKEMECECSEDWKREFGWYYSILVIGIYILLIILLIILAIFYLYLMLSKK